MTTKRWVLAAFIVAGLVLVVLQAAALVQLHERGAIDYDRLNKLRFQRWRYHTGAMNEGEADE